MPGSSNKAPYSKPAKPELVTTVDLALNGSFGAQDGLGGYSST